MIRTVLGDIQKNELGCTLAHEHFIVDLDRVRKDGYSFIKDVDEVVPEIKKAMDQGIQAAFEVTTNDMGRDPLKLKEISYIHSEAYAAGELKHGTISLIEDNTLVIGVLTQQKVYEKTVSNMVECKARGAYLMGLTGYGNYSIEDTCNFTTYIPKVDDHFMASLAVVPLQLLGYYISVARGLDVDKPRNLAKSVTVE